MIYSLINLSIFGLENYQYYDPGKILDISRKISIL